MVKIWGLDLKEMQWGKFKSSYMWNDVYHMRRTRFIVYQCAMIFCVVSESLGTAALSNYIDQQQYITRMDERATVHNNDFVGSFSYNIFVGVFVATIFGSAFFFDLFWPERFESRAVKLAWRICSVLCIAFTLSAALLLTIVLSTHTAKITGVDAAEARELLIRSKPNEPLVYKHNKRGIASVVFIWPGFIATIASTVLLWHSLAHIDTYGPFSSHARPNCKDDFELPSEPNPDATSAAAAALGSSSPRVPYDVDDTGVPTPPEKVHQAHAIRYSMPYEQTKVVQV
ncbi:hypothetical protein NA57DRAFT_35706 [Rhizodiscina lignyota]|uniref:Uncharacterized protein n=1 Tax=Rhizodiscina lignyota TaxID=1504668 RepID=A0A9P4MBW8_9PEZI|nr:hypothetical protein NA57DRAFT_35706 [Rhizodiscina lignyota]